MPAVYYSRMWASYNRWSSTLLRGRRYPEMPQDLWRWLYSRLYARSSLWYVRFNSRSQFKITNSACFLKIRCFFLLCSQTYGRHSVRDYEQWPGWRSFNRLRRFSYLQIRYERIRPFFIIIFYCYSDLSIRRLPTRTWKSTRRSRHPNSWMGRRGRCSILAYC